MSQMMIATHPVIQAPAAIPLPVPWRDPHTVPREVLKQHVLSLEDACRQNPSSPALWTSLGIAYAMDFRVERALDALGTARDVQPEFYWGQQKYAELLYRLRALPKAEEETLRALQLASSTVEYAISRRQLQEIRRLKREGTQKPAWTKPLGGAAIVSLLVCIGLCLLGLVLK